MGSQVRGKYDSKSVIPFAPAAKNAAPDLPINSTKQGKPFLDYFTRPPTLLKQTVSMPSKWPRSFPISSEQPKIGSPS